MPTTNIDNVKIEHSGDVNRGLEYLRSNWNDTYILEVFRDARTSSDNDGVFKVPGIDGHYVLRHSGGDSFSLGWRSE